MLFRRWALLFALYCSSLSTEPLFLGVSIPKSGTHLLIKLLNILTDGKPIGSWNGTLSQDQFALRLLNLEGTRLYSFSHANEPHYLEFAKNQPEIPKIIQIRDLRDALVSAVFHFDSKFEKLGLTSFDEKLTSVITSKEIYTTWIKNNVQFALQWMAMPNAFVVRFEDLVGNKGQGNDEKQRETILSIATLLHIHVRTDWLDSITDHLFGEPNDPVSRTFRRGQIGTWKEYFQPSHKWLFNQYWGEYQQALGYPLCEI
jgi:hypothetical protein